MAIIIAVMLTAAFLFAIYLRLKSGTEDDPHATGVPANDDGILLLIRQQKLIQAIKLYREVHHVDLKAAKDAVDVMASTGRAVAPPAGSVPDGSVDDADVISMIRQGNTIDAIRMYRELHGTDLKSAKDAVDALAKKLQP